LDEGELEIGQIASLIGHKGIQSVADVMQELTEGYDTACHKLANERW